MSSPSDFQGPSHHSAPQMRSFAAMVHAEAAASAVAPSIHGHPPPTMWVPERTRMDAQAFNAEPPRHTRPLYWSIPLPDDDDLYGSAGPSYSIQQHPSTVSQATAPFLVVGDAWTSSTLYPSGHFLIGKDPEQAGQRADAVQFPIDGAVSAEIHVALAPYIGARDHDRTRSGGYGHRVTRVELLEPMTNPPVQHLVVVSVVDGSKVEVHGRLGNRPYGGVVVVSDVLDAIETLRDQVGRRIASGGQSLLLSRGGGWIQPGLTIQQHLGGMVGTLVVGLS